MFMIPESSANKTIDLYECKEFPYTWNHKMTLFNNIDAVDTNLIFHKSFWWLFTNIKSNTNLNYADELHLYYSKNLFNKKSGK